MLPALLDAGGIKVGISESDLKEYPGMYLRRDAGDSTTLRGAFPAYVLADAPGGHMNFHKEVAQRADYLAIAAGQRSYPWRLLILAEQDRELLDSDLVYQLARPAAAGTDFSWVKPGKVAWDWWNAWNLKGVDFKTGINTETYKYYVDFAAKYGIEYINLDEGWSDQFDLLKLNPEVDPKEIIRYAESKGVGVLLWCVARTLDRQMDTALKSFAAWGARGVKVDFMDRDDQAMVDFYWRTAETAEKYQLMVNFHGAYKPTGMNRAFPNVINCEAVRGLEYNKFARPEGTTSKHAVSIPFIRMLAGPMDYTPGAMTNVRKEDFYVVNDRPMSQGTRCHQLAMYVVYEAPLQMLADAPTAYEAEPEIMEFLGPVPTTWDETYAIDGQVGEYAIIARRKGEDWYVGGMTSEARNVPVDFRFLAEKVYNADIYLDGINANRLGEDYRRSNIQISPLTRMVFDMAPGGGFVLRLTPGK
jgi:alpha-glucosidase